MFFNRQATHITRTVYGDCTLDTESPENSHADFLLCEGLGVLESSTFALTSGVSVFKQVVENTYSFRNRAIASFIINGTRHVFGFR